MSHRILVIHGPNLNLLGNREVEIYGSLTLNEINERLKKKAASLDVVLDAIQSNHEGEIVDKIGQARESYAGILMNPAAYTHTSIAIRDALLASTLPCVEVHLSNIYKREDFRKKSLTAPACLGVVTGFGANSYLLGLEALVESLNA
jgi:3-dehydroquinate dehydratase-2